MKANANLCANKYSVKIECDRPQCSSNKSYGIYGNKEHAFADGWTVSYIERRNNRPVMLWSCPEHKIF